MWYEFSHRGYVALGFTFSYFVYSFITGIGVYHKDGAPGFVQVMEDLESHGIYEFHFQAWKVMEFKNFISRPGKSWNLIVDP